MSRPRVGVGLMLCVLCGRGAHAGDLNGKVTDAAGAPVPNAVIDNIAADDRIVPLFKDTKIDHFRAMLIEQFCNLSGGPCAYTGETMEKSHGGMHITEAQFNALVEDLYRAMENARTPVRAQNRLVALLAPMRPQIIHQ
jgi:hypothetical protein